MNAYNGTLLVLLIVTTVVELIGVARNPKGPGGGDDTISEMWWTVRNRFPLLTLAMVAFLAWLAFHFVAQGWRKS